MRAWLVAAVVVLVGFGFGAETLAAQTKTEQELLQLENDWCTAELKRDGTIFGRILADDYSGVSSRGLPETKAGLVASLKDTTTSVTACANSNLKVRVYGDAAVVTGLITRSGKNKGAAYKDRQVLFTDTFIRRAGQ